jgi:3-hydroxybutyryl-CoA dehydrogenase
MGAGIAQVFAQSGRNVLLQDAVPGAVERGIAAIRASLDKLASKGKITPEAAASTLTRIRPAAAGDAISANLVVEAIVENAESKKVLFAELNRIVPPDVVFASNTSSISISELGAASGRARQFVGMHFFNPVPLMQLVEIVVGLETAEEVVEATTALATEIGKVPHRVKDYPGFVSNRVLMPLINEGISCLSDGVADAKTIDEIMKLGCNHPMGPLALADLIGLDTCLYIMEVLHRDLGEDRYRPHPLLRTMVRAGKLGRKVKQGFYKYE